MTDHTRVLQLINGYWASQIVGAAATYGFADHLAHGPATPAEIADAAGTDPDATARLLRACHILGLVESSADERYTGTPLLATLRADAPSSLKDLATIMVSPVHWLPWGQFSEAVKTGRPQAIATLGEGPFDYLSSRPEGATFARAMKGVLKSVSNAVAEHLDLTGVDMVADIGSASGASLIPLLTANPGLRGVAFDLPGIVDSEDGRSVRADFQDRITAIGGNFFDGVPQANLYLLRHILHDWNDKDSIRILANCRMAMPDGGRIAIIEQVMAEPGEPTPVALMDMNMMVVLGGRERTLSEFAMLCSAAGLRITRAQVVHPTATIIEAIAL